MGMLEMTDQDTALRWHLTSNHFPPVPESMIEPCKAAIDAMNDGQFDKPIPLPEGVTYRGMSYSFAYLLVDSFHLDGFLTQEEIEW
jgi:hypothetical protein